MNADQLDALRHALLSDQRDAYAQDPDLRHLLGGKRFRQDLNTRYESAGVLLDSDRESASKTSLGKYSGAALLAEIGSSASSGASAVKAVAGIAESLGKSVVTGGAGFVRAGSAALGLFLSPFGAAGRGVGSIVGTIGSGLLNVLGSGGTLVATGLKLGGSLAGGIVGGITGVLGVGIGGAIGAIVGGGLPGAVAGGLLAGGLMAGLTGLVSAAIGSLSSALGNVLGAVGKAVSDLGSSIASTLSNVKDVLGDLISTGKDWATATAGISRNSGLSMAQAGVGSSLANILTGNPNGLSGFFGNFAHNAAFAGGFARGWGMTGTDPNSATSPFLSAFNRWQSIGAQGGPMAAVNQQIMMKGFFGSSADAVGNLFSAGRGMVNLALATAQKTAMTPQQTQQSLTLGFQIDAIQANLDALKNKFLSDLMPTIEWGLGKFTTFLNANEGTIVKSLTNFGKFLFVNLPNALQKGSDALITFADSFIKIFPSLFDSGLKIMVAAITTIQSIVKELAPLLGKLSPSLGKALMGIGNADISKYLYSKDGAQHAKNAEALQGQIDPLQKKIDYAQAYLKDPHYGENLGSTHSVDPKDPDVIKTQQNIAAAQAQIAALKKQMDDENAAALATNPLSASVHKTFGGMSDWMDKSGYVQGAEYRQKKAEIASAEAELKALDSQKGSMSAGDYTDKRGGIAQHIIDLQDQAKAAKTQAGLDGNNALGMGFFTGGSQGRQRGDSSTNLDAMTQAVMIGIQNGINGSSVTVKSHVTVAPTDDFHAKIAEQNAEMMIRALQLTH